MNRSPDRGTFQLENREDYVELFKSMEQRRLELEESPGWKVDNLEYDLRSSELIIEKCKDRVYAQHIYAALCNNEFQRNDVMPILQDKTWSCSWRYAGGIVADIRQEGDYIDWYCSGIRGNPDDVTDIDFNSMSDVEKINHLESKAHVSESVVTDEVRQDLFTLGWIVKD